MHGYPNGVNQSKHGISVCMVYPCFSTVFTIFDQSIGGGGGGGAEVPTARLTFLSWLGG